MMRVYMFLSFLDCGEEKLCVFTHSADTNTAKICLVGGKAAESSGGITFRGAALRYFGGVIDTEGLLAVGRLQRRPSHLLQKLEWADALLVVPAANHQHAVQLLANLNHNL
jgi:hypothetical protein